MKQIPSNFGQVNQKNFLWKLSFKDYRLFEIRYSDMDSRLEEEESNEPAGDGLGPLNPRISCQNARRLSS